LKLLEAVSSSSSQSEDVLHNSSACDAPSTAGYRQELVEKLLKNVAVASEVLLELSI